MREWRLKNKDKVHHFNQNWYQNGGFEKKKAYDTERLEEVRERDNTRYRMDETFRIKKVLRTRIRKVLKGQTKHGKSLDLLGCKLDFYMKWMEYQFTADMTWDNYGTIWNIDHVRPCSSFDLSDIHQQVCCFNWKNTRPLYKNLNETKNDKIDTEIICQHKETVDKFLKSYEAVPKLV
jgi:hypothetical protein